jgi:hypothetical protein
MSSRGDGATLVAGGAPRNDWTVVAAYCAVSSANQMLWLTFAPVTTVAARHYGVAVSSMGWMANVFPLIYVILALPAGYCSTGCFVAGSRSARCSPPSAPCFALVAATSESWQVSLSSRSLSLSCSTP